MEQIINTPEAGQDNNNIVMPSPQQEGLENQPQEGGDDLDQILQRVEAEEVEELKERIGEENYAKLAKFTEKQIVTNFLKTVNEETGRNYKDIEDVAKSIKEGAKFYQKAKQLEEELAKLQQPAQQVGTEPQNGGQEPNQVASQQAVQPQQVNQQVDPSQQPGQVPNNMTGENAPATQQAQQPNGAIDPILLETRADLIEIKDPRFATVRNEVLRVARQHNVMPDVVYNGEGLFADYAFKERAKNLAQNKSNNVMSSTASDNTGQGGISKEQIIKTVQNMSPKEIAKALKISNRR